MASPKIEELRAQVRGQVITEVDAGYEDARKVYNAMHDRKPAVVVRCADAGDVIAGVNYAREQGGDLSVRGGSHSAPGFGTNDDGVVIDLSPMRGIRVDPRAQTARAEAGCTWGDFNHATHAFGLATTGGIISSTGVAGLTLGGGHGWLMRRHGLTCDNLLSVRLVTADGRRVTANADENPDLFWGVRGGGGNFGIVTSFEFRLHPVTTVLAGFVLYPLTQAREVFRVYRECVGTAPDELTAAVLITTWSDGTPAIAVVVCHGGDLGVGERLVQPVRNLGGPIVDTIRRMSYGELQTTFDATNPPGAWYYRTGYLTGETVLGDDFVTSCSRRRASRHRRRCRASSSSTSAARWRACPPTPRRSCIARPPST